MDLVTLDPNQEIKFFKQADQSMKAFITIDNISPQNVAFKIKTTQPKFYVVKPNQSIIEKNQNMIIDITL